MKMPKPKKMIRTREEILKDLKKNKKFQEKMKFTREVFYPALKEATTSIEDALQHLTIINNIIMEKALGFMQEKYMKEIELAKNLSIDDPKYQKMKEMIEIFDQFTVFDAKDMIEGMRNEINLFISEENKKRTLDQLETKWIDEL